MKTFQLLFLLGILFSFGPDAFPSTKNCQEELLKFNGAFVEFSIDKKWEFILDLIGLEDESDRAETKAAITFSLEVLKRRAQGGDLQSLRSLYLNQQALKLLGQQQALLDQWPEMVAWFKNEVLTAVEKRAKEKKIRSLTEVDDALAQVVQRAAATRTTLEILRNSLSRSLSMEGPTYSTLFYEMFFTAAIIESLSHWLDGDLEPREESMTRGQMRTFQSEFKFNIQNEHAVVREWAATQVSMAPLSSLQVQMDLIEKFFNEEGVFPVPSAGTVSAKRTLALAFLPMRFLTFDAFSSRVGRNGRRLAPSEAFLEDLFLSIPIEFPVPKLSHKNSPTHWARGLGDSLRTWHVLLGGHPEFEGEESPQGVHPLKERKEAPIRALLYYLRFFVNDEIGIKVDWSDPRGVLERLYNDLMFNHPWKGGSYLNSELFSSLQHTWPNLYGDLLPSDAKKKYTEADLVEAADQLVARLLQDPRMKITNKSLKELFRRFPDSAVSIKLLFLKSIF